MSNIYEKFRSEIAAGGAVEQSDGSVDRKQSLISGAAILGLLAWLGLRDAWILVFVLGLLISVFLHEVGHFVTAHRTGMKVTQFYMGFGPRLWSTTRGGVEYGIRALPLGAFVRIVGMNNLDEVDPADEPVTYRAQSYPRKLLVITAGSLMHLIIGVVLFTTVYSSWGRYQELGAVTVSALADGDSPASRAGIQEGDVIVAIDDTTVTTRSQFVNAIVANEPGDQVTVSINRDGTSSTLDVVLAEHPDVPGSAFFGVASTSAGYLDLGVIESVGRSVADIGTTVTESVKGLVAALNPVNSLEHLTNEIADPATRPTTVVGISQVSGSVGESDGLKGILLLLASLNIFVGVFNMLPLLPFDGGHAAIATYERLRSRPGKPYRADISKMIPVATTVVVLLAFLLATGLYLDLTRPLG
ncbi:MAG: site-2 protease family protein [Actinobacteria bacterium]|nr:site-2 protease family protein [Actinomycetota bacterium]